MRTIGFYGLTVFLAILVAGCGLKKNLDYSRELPPGKLALRKITDPKQIPDFTLACMNTAGLKHTIQYSLEYFQKPSSRRFFPYGNITHAQAVSSLRHFLDLLDSGLKGAQLNRVIREQYDVYISVGCDSKGTVLFTGYYTPIFEGSLERSGPYRYPLYGPPDDLVKNEDGDILGRRLPDGRIVAYPSRREIESSGILQGKEVVWLKDPFQVYIAHVQGSAKIRLPDRRLITIGYAASNGREYKSIAKKLVEDGKIPAEKLSLSAMMDYFRQNPQDIKAYVDQNPRFVFFQREEGPPRGSLNVPVTPYRSIATDKTIFPRGCLTFVDTVLPRALGATISKRKFQGFALDQDTGGAIRAPGRCDVYLGEGDLAGRLAGQTYEEGKLYYLFLKSAGPANMAGASGSKPGQSMPTGKK